jgi:hypothetical protein
VEKQIEVWKAIRQTDKNWQGEDTSLFGQVLVSFHLQDIVTCQEQVLSIARSLSKYSVRHILEEFSKAFFVTCSDQVLEYEVPKKDRDLDKNLGFNLFPKLWR